ncbi:MAG: helix-turn-helix transcriptional regulator [Lachnospiraceae bacterium]|nr:helix-turn-helix transcriptional regulator [Lachnospiraceae bacterium]
MSSTTSAPYEIFGSRLSAACKLARISNIQLSKMVNVDPSHISRFRKGQRAPKSSPQLADNIQKCLYHRICEQGQQEQLRVLMQDQIALLPSTKIDNPDLESAFKKWLLNYSTTDQTAAMSLIHGIGNFSLDPAILEMEKNASLSSADLESDFQIRISAGNADSTSLPPKENLSFYNNTGLQEAVLQFLQDVIRYGGKELLLFSDLPMNWLLDDPSYTMKWKAAMAKCVKYGVRITIIHNIDRDMKEMVEAIYGWLPLYLAGTIHPLYSQKTMGGRFYHTLFVCPGIAAIEGWQSQSPKGNGLYRLLYDPAEIEHFASLFQDLKGFSQPLLKFIRNTREQDETATEPDTSALVCPVISLNGTSIFIEKNSVTVKRQTEPYFGFVFYHPMMIRAFTQIAELSP